MKEKNFVTRAIAIVAFLAVMVYFGVSIAGYLIDPLTTTRAYYYQSDDAVIVSGYVIRDEEVLSDSSSTGLLYITRDEGERVSKGKSVATVYHSQEALDQAERLEELQLQLEQLQYAQSVASGSQEVLKLDSTIMDSIFSLKSDVADENFTAASQESSSLQALVLRRGYTYEGEDSAIGDQISALEQEIRTLSASTQRSSTSITVPHAGYYSAVVDGYETVLTPDMLETLTPQTLRQLQPDTSVSSSVGKLISGSTWYYAAAVDAAEIGDLQEGDAITLRFVSGLEKDIPMTVYSIGKEENGEVVVVFSTDRYLSVTTLLRHQNAQVIFHSYEGIRVPTEALRVVTETIVDADGNENTLQFTAVYCRVGLLARSKPVTVVYQGEDYYLVTANPSAIGNLSETQTEIYTLRSGDEIIVTARDLYDGKVIGS